MISVDSGQWTVDSGKNNFYMNTIVRFGYKISILFICFWVASAIIFLLFDIEFIDPYWESGLKRIRFYGILIAAPVSLFLTQQASKSKSTTIGNVIAAIISFCLIFLGYGLYSLSGMCSWSTSNELYIHKTNPDIKLIERAYGCGAWDSDSPTLGVFKEYNVYNILVYRRQIDESSFDYSSYIEFQGRSN